MKSQGGFQFSIGYGLGSAKIDSLNWVLNRYNETRNFLTEEMTEIKTHGGLCLHFGYENEKIGLIESGITWRTSQSSALGIDNSNILKRRDVRLTMHSIDLDYSYPVFNKFLSVAPGIGNSFGALAMSTIVGTPSEVKNSVKKDYYEVQREFLYQCRLFLKLSIGNFIGSMFKIELQPYYSISFGETDFAALNNEINAYSASGDPPNLRSSISHLGVKAMLVFYLSTASTE